MQQSDRTAKMQPWIVLAAASAINLTMGITYSWSIIKKALVVDMHWTNVEASLPYTLYTAVFAIMTVVGGRAQDQHGPRLVASTGCLCLAMGFLLCGYSNTPLLMMLGYGLLCGMGNALCYSTTMPSSIKWFPPEKKGLIAGIVVSGTSLATVYMSPAINWLVAGHGISYMFIVLGVVICTVIAPSAQLLKFPPVGDHPGTDRAGQPPLPGAAAATRDLPWQQVLRTATFLKLWVMFLFATSAGLMIIGHIATIAKTQADWDNGYYLIILLALFNTGGRMSGGWFSDKYGRVRMMQALLCVQAANMMFFASYVNPVMLAVGAALTGLCYGAAFILFPVAVADFFGLKNLGVNYGMILTAWGVAGIFGPILAGWAVDATGTYNAAYSISAGLLLAALAVTFTIKSYGNSSAPQPSEAGGRSNN